MTGIAPFDPRALTAPADPAAARAFSTRLRAEGRLPAGGTAARVTAVAIGIGLFAGLGVAIVAVVALLSTFLREGTLIVALIFLVPVLIGIGGMVAVYAVARHADRVQMDRRWRLARFAEAVGMTYVPAIPNPPLPGAIFSIDGDRTAYDLLRGTQPRFVEIGNHSYTVSDGKTTTTSRWGYIAIKLGVPLPHIVLDATANDIVLGSWRRDQHLSLESDFDRHFRLYCPAGYERDALYLFTPDVMARFIDSAAVLDVEIVDDWLLLYARDEMTTLDPARWAWTFSVVAALLDKLEQWERWRDDRLRDEDASAGRTPDAGSTVPGAAGVSPVASSISPSAPGGVLPTAGYAAPTYSPAMPFSPPPGVAPTGRRLQRRSPWLVAGIVVGVLLLGTLALMVVPALFLLSVR